MPRLESANEDVKKNHSVSIFTTPTISSRVLPRKKGIAGGCGQGGVCDHINHLDYHIKDKLVLKEWGTTMLKGPRENTAA